MLRRLLYAGVLVYWVDRSYFQIQFMILHSSFIMIYMGYFRPYQLNFSNNLEVINETLTLVCTYSLMLFSSFVPDPAMRYLCGWYLIGLIVLTLAVNLTIIVGQALKSSIRKCKQKC